MCETVVEKITHMMHTVAGKEVAILGLAYKPHTSSVAGSASLAVARRLALSGARVRAYDPVALAEAKQQLQSAVRYCDTPYAAAEYTMDHLDLTPQYHKNISYAQYEAGHMVYLESQSHAKMKQDFVNFIDQTTQKTR